MSENDKSLIKITSEHSYLLNQSKDKGAFIFCNCVSFVKLQQIFTYFIMDILARTNLDYA
ncbi:hypothetical protein ACA30_16210 [Virgibacillus soli]|uniref:Uncharacterized protein n=1 Tax=Lederbergia galactosidilytica TaxID=217031 RepID=A0A178A037_9BACI|nr:hypothetical protein ACA30_16210 [Virgibacillus soli]OAK73526.1 hypothetical protein ABB05_06755 [Lederbergia galactosidilytica]